MFNKAFFYFFYIFFLYLELFINEPINYEIKDLFEMFIVEFSDLVDFSIFFCDLLYWMINLFVSFSFFGKKNCKKMRI